ncbi:MAG: thiol protease/hemagglutinin PrtT [Bacteroidales bacterium]|nr:thiol protease/hemagglutinin PrtT [Bacteroidales bacterium]
MKTIINTSYKKVSIPFLLLITFLFSINLNAKNVSLETASQLAVNVFSEKTGLAKSLLEIKEIISIRNGDLVLYRIFNFSPNGYIVVTADDNVRPVIGYGLKSNFDFAKAPPALIYLLNEYKNELEYIIENKLNVDEENTVTWRKYSDKNYVPNRSYTLGDNLIKTTWGQRSPYNSSCPLDPNTGRRCLVGCTAVALGQILNYWNCKVFPDGTKTYFPNIYFQSPLTVNFYDQNYDWDIISTQPASAADLLYHCGVAIGVNYSETATSGISYNVEQALINYFGFQTLGLQPKNEDMTTWINMLKNDIDKGRPIYYAGINTTVYPNTGHAWVIDGYKQTDEFHCNWGWDGEHDDYYYLANLIPGTSNYNSNQQAIIGAEPILDDCFKLDGLSTICFPDTTQYKVTIPSTASVIWGKSTNLTQIGSNTNTIFKVRASGSGNGFVTATIKNSQGQVFLTRTKNIWVGMPHTPTDIIPFWNNGMEFGNDSYYEFRVRPHPSSTYYTWQVDGGTIISGQGTNWITVKTIKIPANVQAQFGVAVKAGNNCGESVWFNRTGWVVPGTGATRMLLSPNPTSGETFLTIESNTIETTFDENTLWDLEVYSGSNLLQTKQTGLRGRNARIQTAGWKEGVYLVRIIYQDGVLTGKLIVE